MFPTCNATISLQVPCVYLLLPVPSLSHTPQNSYKFSATASIPQISSLLCLSALSFTTSPQTQPILFYLHQPSIFYTLHWSSDWHLSWYPRISSELHDVYTPLMLPYSHSPHPLLLLLTFPWLSSQTRSKLLGRYMPTAGLTGRHLVVGQGTHRSVRNGVQADC